MLALGLALYVATLVLVLWRPRGLSVGWSAMGGAVLALAAGLVSVHDVPVVWGVVWDATFTLVSLILISLTLDAAGFFAWCALHVARWGGGSGPRLFTLLIALSSALAAAFANDGAVLIMTPLTLALADALKLERQAKLAFLLATGYVVDSTSLPFTISNLTNIVVANYFGIGFAEYAARMVPVNLVAFAASLGALWVLFRGVVPARVDLSRLDAPRVAVLDPLVFALGWIVLPLLFAGYFLAKPLGLPLCAVAGAGAGVLLLAALHGHLARARVRAGISVVTILREAPWSVVWFSLGMYLIVFGLRNHGATQPVVVLLEALQGTPAIVAALVSGTVFAILAAVMNNLPAVLFGSLAIEQARLGDGARELFVYANVIGAGLGPKMTPIGSLATLLWMHVLAQYGVRVGWRRFCLVGLKLTIPVLAATLAGLAAVLALRASAPS